MCDYETVESVGDVLFERLHELVQTPFFKYFRVSDVVIGILFRPAHLRFQADLYRECPFWEENVLCMSKDCSIITVDEVRLVHTALLL